MGYLWNDNDKEQPKYCINPCPTATLYTTNYTRTILGLEGERLANNCVNHPMGQQRTTLRC